MDKYSIVIPCYNSSGTISKVVEITTEELKTQGINDFEFVLVNDCSPDNGKTIGKLKELAQKYSFVKVINLGKNAGQHNAIMAGLNYADGDFVIGMDDDMQTHPSQLKKLIVEINKGFDIVYGFYAVKKESFFRRIGSSLNYWTVRILIGKPKWLKTSSYWIIRKYVRDYAIEYKFPYVHLQGVFLRITKNIACVEIEHFEREMGTSTYTLKKLFQLYMNIIGFSMIPLRMVMHLGMVFSVIGFVSAITITIKKILEPTLVVGWSSLMAGMCFFSGLILLGMGVLGEYVGRLFIGETCTPQYVVKETYGMGKEKKE